jgi:type IV pilus assembly protein PilB
MSVLSPRAQAKVEDILVEQGLLTKDKLNLLKSQARTQSKPFFSMLLEGGHISDEELTQALAKANDTPYVNLINAHINPRVLDLLDKDVAEHYMAVPLGTVEDILVVAMLDANNVQAVDFLSEKIGKPLRVYAASESGIRHILEQYDQTRGINEILAKPPELSAEGAGGKETPEMQALGSAPKKTQTIVQDSPISKALSAIMDYAARSGASDIHVEPLEKVLKVRLRVDGVLREIMELPKSAEAPLVSRIKILSNLKIDEHRSPQDGQFTLQLKNNAIDIRVAISPVIWGEQVVMRLLDKSGTSLCG